MTYLEYLMLFIVFPSIVLLILNVRSFDKSVTGISALSALATFVFLSAIAILYTTPWDNYLVEHAIWSYDPAKILGIIIGFVPLEEYTFFVLETVFVFLVINFAFSKKILHIQPDTITDRSPDSLPKFFVLIGLAYIWFVSVFSFLLNIESMLYLNLLLLWAIPPIFLQIFIGWPIIRSNLKQVVSIVVLLGSYLSLTDAFAIFTGIWSISPIYTIGIVFFIIPLEEVLFFFLTVVLIFFGQLISYSMLSKYVFNNTLSSNSEISL